MLEAQPQIESDELLAVALGVHPLSSLLRLISELALLSDEEEQVLRKSVSDHFGSTSHVSPRAVCFKLRTSINRWEPPGVRMPAQLELWRKFKVLLRAANRLQVCRLPSSSTTPPGSRGRLR